MNNHCQTKKGLPDTITGKCVKGALRLVAFWLKMWGSFCYFTHSDDVLCTPGPAGSHGEPGPQSEGV